MKQSRITFRATGGGSFIVATASGKYFAYRGGTCVENPSLTGINFDSWTNYHHANIQEAQIAYKDDGTLIVAGYGPDWQNAKSAKVKDFSIKRIVAIYADVRNDGEFYGSRGYMLLTTTGEIYEYSYDRTTGIPDWYLIGQEIDGKVRDIYGYNAQHSLVLTEDGKVYEAYVDNQTGITKFKQLNFNGEQITNLYAYNYNIALSATGKLYVWGSSSNLLPGLGGITSSVQPILVEGALATEEVANFYTCPTGSGYCSHIPIAETKSGRFIALANDVHSADPSKNIPTILDSFADNKKVVKYLQNARVAITAEGEIYYTDNYIGGSRIISLDQKLEFPLTAPAISAVQVDGENVSNFEILDMHHLRVRMPAHQASKTKIVLFSTRQTALDVNLDFEYVGGDFVQNPATADHAILYIPTTVMVLGAASLFCCQLARRH